MNAGKFVVSYDLLKMALNLPDDIAILGVEQSSSSQTLLIYAASSAFPEVPEGAMISETLRANVKTEYCEHGAIIKRWTEWGK